MQVPVVVCPKKSRKKIFSFKISQTIMAKLALIVLFAACIGVSNALTHAEALRRLQAVGVTVSSSGGCSDRNKPTCTSLDTVRENTVSGLVTLKTASGCAITVTGGTETGHSSGTYSHWNGYKADISLNTCINDYVTTRFTYIGLRGDGAPMYQAASGNVYAKEGNHWDIVFY